MHADFGIHVPSYTEYIHVLNIFCDSPNKKEKEPISMNPIMTHYTLDMSLYVTIERFREMIAVHKSVAKVPCSIIHTCLL